MKLTDLSGLSSKRLEALSSEGIHSATDLLNFFPRRFLDRSNTQKIKHLAGSGEEITVAGKVTTINMAGYGRKKRLEVTINDG
ncbi:MAG TPA: ATP-dependent DNA helicase RecG, partial [Balneolaceae bacterium]|nr:ATP-dependent DNA helicase RecG [Balneolaceae bacterium]